MKKSIAIMLMGLLVFAACSVTKNGNLNEGQNSEFMKGDKIKKFSDAKEVGEFLKEMKAQNYNNYNRGRFFFAEEMITTDAMAESSLDKITGTIADNNDYSGTNNQVSNVDEADFIKTDGEYIYQLQNNKLIIVKAYPAETAEIISETTLNGNAHSLFIKGDKAIVFTYDNELVQYFYRYGIYPSERYVSLTKATTYDISDREEPKEVDEYTIKGGFFEARMVGEYVYFITKESVNYYENHVDLPIIRSESGITLQPDIYYFPNPENTYVFHTIASINIEDEEINAESYLLGYSNNLYMTEHGMYISYEKNYPRPYYEDEEKERFFEVVVPLLPEEYSNKIKKYENKEVEESWNEISNILKEMFDEVSEAELESRYKEIEKAVREYDIKVNSERQKTIIQKLAVENGEITHLATGEVKGMLHNQFSLDEYDDNLRVATTLSVWTRSGSVTHNNVYVLDDEMNLIGALEEIAPDESIYSTRFMGERLYMVTFERIDPLFVIDLSNPSNPNILGELKIPGFSDYLHPYDENHIIGIGKETAENEWGRISTKGVKLSLFDVSDVSKPKQLDTYIIGGRGTDSEALNEHKAFLFNKEKNILVIPIREVDYDNVDVAGGRYYERYRVWQGAYAFGLTPEEGFSLKGTVSHESFFDREHYWYGSPYAVRRSLYINDILYTVSEAKIVMNNLGTMEEVNELDLGYKEKVYPEMPIIID